MEKCRNLATNYLILEDFSFSAKQKQQKPEDFNLPKKKLEEISLNECYWHSKQENLVQEHLCKIRYGQCIFWEDKLQIYRPPWQG